MKPKPHHPEAKRIIDDITKLINDPPPQVVERMRRMHQSQQNIPTQNPHPLDVDQRIDKLANIKHGWLNGEGKALNQEGLTWLRNTLQSQITFPTALLPYLYPTIEGGVQAEWSITNIDIALNINLTTHQAIWSWSDLSTDQYGERKLNLDSENDWQWIKQTLTTMISDQEQHNTSNSQYISTKTN